MMYGSVPGRLGTGARGGDRSGWEEWEWGGGLALLNLRHVQRDIEMAWLHHVVKKLPLLLLLGGQGRNVGRILVTAVTRLIRGASKGTATESRSWPGPCRDSGRLIRRPACRVRPGHGHG